MSEVDVQHIGYDIPVEEPTVEDRFREKVFELAMEVLGEFPLVTRITIVEALFDIDVEVLLRGRGH
jgi:hypothetical protein